VLVNGIPCPLLYVSPVQINVIAPYALYNKTSANVAVRYPGLLSASVPVTVTTSAPGLFSFPPTGMGPGAILNQDQSVNTAANPAAKGTIICLFGGGGGQTTPQGIDGLFASTSVLPQLMLPVSVTLGGVAATDISYVGAAPALVSGALQVNVRIRYGAFRRSAGGADNREHDQPVGAGGECAEIYWRSTTERPIA
jgi:uncharacterized protein (TIGR03437 family)